MGRRFNFADPSSSLQDKWAIEGTYNLLLFRFMKFITERTVIRNFPLIPRDFRLSARSFYIRNTNLLFWIILLSLTLFASILMAASSISNQNPTIFLVFIFLGMGGYALCRHLGRSEGRLFLILYAVNVIITVALFSIYMDRYGVPYFIGGSDDLAYEKLAEEAAQKLEISEYRKIETELYGRDHNSLGYVYFLSLSYRLLSHFGGFHTMMPRLLNSMLIGFIAVITFRLGLIIGLTRRVALWAAIILGLLPIVTYVGAHTFRDVITSFLTLWVVYIWARSLYADNRTNRIFLWAQTVLVVLILTQFRWYQAIVTLGIAFLAESVPYLRLSVKSIAKTSIAIIIVLVMVLALLSSRGWSFLELFERLSDSQTSYSNYREALSDGLASIVFNSPAPLTYVLRIGYALVLPLPILSSNIERLWLSFGTLVQFLFLPFTLVGVTIASRDRRNWHMIAGMMLLFLGAALITFTDRHILQYLPYAVMFSAVGVTRYKRYRSVIWLIAGWLGILLALLYVYLKNVL